jgi:hypothetical protein
MAPFQNDVVSNIRASCVTNYKLRGTIFKNLCMYNMILKFHIFGKKISILGTELKS